MRACGFLCATKFVEPKLGSVNPVQKSSPGEMFSVQYQAEK